MTIEEWQLVQWPKGQTVINKTQITKDCIRNSTRNWRELGTPEGKEVAPVLCRMLKI
jgi:hypothetical protein